MLVSDVMTRIPVTLNSRQNIYEAWKLIADLKVVGLPVVDEGGQVIGIVTRDSLLALGLETIAKYDAQGTWSKSMPKYCTMSNNMPNYDIIG